MLRGVFLLVTSVPLFLLSGWGLLWLLSSSSLASGFCENDFSLFHEHFRCRQPYLAIMLVVVSGAAFMYFLVSGIKKIQKAKNAT